ncbi:glucose 1-dehydrogenase [Microbaculum marinum]|uniref:Glucose 1-dehydrogenase n=1 Tax=Microbaculum marinum TaxID=1764581 RepID=A0AAW9RX69_9HYPH
MRMFDLTGRVAIVTGGNGGIGLGMARGLAEAGATVVVAARNAEKNAAALEEINQTGPSSGGSGAVAIATDIRKPEACKALVEETAGRFGRIDILVNNSGINYRKQPQDFTLEEWYDVIDTNLTAAFVLCQAVYPHFLKAGGGKIINVGSLMSFMGGPVAVAYGPSKGGILQLTKALTCAWAKDNIQANAVLPGWIDTPLSVKARADLPGLEESVLARTPAGRWGDPGDFAGVAVFLASPASDYVNGAGIVVDGGYSTKA